MTSMKSVIVKCDQNGNIDVKNLSELAEKHAENLAALMITYPSTHGVFEESLIPSAKSFMIKEARFTWMEQT
ncbi:MAG: hypothetical protein CM1200mP28_06340 [Deltaproteobacteria bacterium]|nr:MAG: hypothetical protein CM1200mP28_06340 [Deltaproteobacteria bacterium]